MDNRGDELPTPIDEVTVKKSPTPSAVSFELESVKTPLLKEQKAEGSSDESNSEVIKVATIETPAGLSVTDGGGGGAMETPSTSGDTRNSTPLTQSHVQMTTTAQDHPTSSGYPMVQQGTPQAAYPYGGAPAGQQQGAYSPYGQQAPHPQMQGGYGGGGYGGQSPYQQQHPGNRVGPAGDMHDDIQKPGPSSGGGGGSGGSYGPTYNRGASDLVSEKTDVEVADDPQYEVGDMILVGLSYMILILLFPLAIFQAVQVLNTYEKAVIFRLGKVKSRQTPTGVVFQLPCTDSITRVDVRTRSINVRPQEILTKDSVTCRVDGIVFYEVIDPIKSVTKVEDVAQSVALSAQTALRTVLGFRTLPEILAAKMAITNDILEIVEDRARSWGVRVLRVDLKDMLLAPQLQRALVAEAETARSAKAQVIRADGEHKAAEILSKASDILNDSKVGVQLRYLQTLSQISGTNNKTVVLPLPPVLAERAINGLVNTLRG